MNCKYEKLCFQYWGQDLLSVGKNGLGFDVTLGQSVHWNHALGKKGSCRPLNGLRGLTRAWNLIAITNCANWERQADGDSL